MTAAESESMNELKVDLPPPDLIRDYGMWCAIDGAWRASQFTGKSPTLFAKWFERYWRVTPREAEELLQPVLFLEEPK